MAQFINHGCAFAFLTLLLASSNMIGQVLSEDTGTNDVTLTFQLPKPFVAGETSITFSASTEDNQQALTGSFTARLQLGNSADPVDITVNVNLIRSTEGEAAASTLKLSGSTSSAITLPGLSSATFEPFKLDASMGYTSGSVSLQSFLLEGKGSMTGIGSFDASFTYEAGDKATLELELTPFNLPSPFTSENGDTVITISADMGAAEQTYKGTFSTKVRVGNDAEPVGITVVVELSTGDTSTLKLSGSTDAAITLPSLSSVTFEPFTLDASLALNPVSLQSFTLEGAGSMTGIGSLTASFTYEAGDKATLSLELTPFKLPSPFVTDDGDTKITIKADMGSAKQIYQGNFATKVKVDDAEPVGITVDVGLSTGEGKSTLKLSGSTDAAITLPSLPSVTFEPFKLNASLAFKPSVSLESFTLEGAGSVAGIGSFDASFTYEDGAPALELELRPAFPKPFEENTTAIMLSYKDAQLQGTFKASIKLEGSEEPVEVESNMVFTSEGFSFDGKTVGTISVPSLDCLTFGEMSLDAELQYSSEAPLKSLSLSGGVGICGVGSNVQASFDYDSASKEAKLEAAMEFPSLGSPFTGSPASVNVLLTKSGEVYGLMGNFTCNVQLPVLTDDLGLSLGIFVQKDADATSIQLNGKTSSSMTFSQFPAFTIGELTLDGKAALSPFKLNSLSLQGSITVAGNTATGRFIYDSASKAMGLKAEMETLDLQALLGAMGMDVNLEGLGVSLSEISFSYATAAIEDLDIPAGMELSATVTVLEMEAETSFQLSSDSSDMAITFGGETFKKAFSTFFDSVKEKLNKVKTKIESYISGRRRALLMERLGPDMLTTDFEDALADGSFSTAMLDDAMLDDATSDMQGLTTYSSRKLQAWNLAAVKTAIEGAIAFANGDGIAFNSLGLEFSIKKGQKPSISVSYDLTFGEKSIANSFVFNGTTSKTGRHLLQMDQLKNMVVEKLVSAAIKYAKGKFPKIAAFLPKDIECTDTGETCGPVCECGACGFTCNDIDSLTLLPANMPNINMSDGSKLFSNEKLNGALKSMCTSLFPSFSVDQLTGGGLDGSAYAAGFSEACTNFNEAIARVPPETWYLVFGLPFGQMSSSPVKLCLAVLPSCSGNNDLQILVGLAGVDITIPIIPPLTLTPKYLGFSSQSSLVTLSSSRLWTMDKTAKTQGSRGVIAMPSTLSLGGSVNMGLKLGSFIEVGLQCDLDFGVNLDPGKDGYGGKDFGFMMAVSATPLVKVMGASKNVLFQIGGPGGGIEAKANLYYWRSSATAGAARELKVGISAKVDFQKLIENIKIGGTSLKDAAGSLASGLPDIKVDVSLFVDAPAPMWGVYLRGTISITFNLPAIVVDFINSRGWGEAVKSLPGIGYIYDKGYNLELQGGIVFQSDEKNQSRFHLGLVYGNPLKVEWFNYGTCAQDSDCLSNQCCGMNLFCVTKPSETLCGAVGKFIGDSLRFIGKTMVAFAEALGAAGDLLAAAGKGIYNFFESAFGGRSADAKCSGCVTPLQFWLMNRGMDDIPYIMSFYWASTYSSFASYRFIGGKDWYSNPKTKLSVLYYDWDNNAVWWYIRKNTQQYGTHVGETITIRSYDDDGLCWDIPGTTMSVDWELQYWECNGSEAQQFFVSPAPVPSDEKGWMMIQPVKAPHLCVTVKNLDGITNFQNAIVVLDYCNRRNDKDKTGQIIKDYWVRQAFRLETGDCNKKILC